MPGHGSKAYGTQRDRYPLRSEQAAMEIVVREDQDKDLPALDLHGAYAGITWPNPGPFDFYAKHGFKEAAVFKEFGSKFGVYCDVHWLEKELNDWNER